MSAPFIYHPTSFKGSDYRALLKAALNGDLPRIKGIVKSLGYGSSDRTALFSADKFGYGVLHCAACAGHLEVCKYFVEELGGDPNMTAAEGMTPLMSAVQFGDLSTVKYFLEHGGDLMKADEKGRTVLHHAACSGSCKVTEFLLSKGIPVDIDHGYGTPLHQAVINEQDKTAKILLDHQANAGAAVDGKGSLLSPLLFATGKGGYTDYVRLLLKAGANPNVPDDLGRLPIELAAINDSREEAEMLFPLTKPIPTVPNWSIDGVVSHAKMENAKPVDARHVKQRKALIKPRADEAFRRKDYETALKEVIGFAPDATLYSNRSLCKLKMGDGEGALSDAYQCRMMRPDWAKACYRQAAAHMLLKEYKQACDALLDAQKLDPENDEIERELRKTMELMKISPDKDMQ
ncbi:hypothetical protein PR202_ga07936 [Eleusine coracana subsp. coracana]|uniref:Serine/threonine-protein kinase BSK1-like TPR repeats domain-containing protein n=1 Tax=Eleusine coracana subsp. coracana TaxID=191504 RepID=A0AAV5C1Y2_ELECO|nr:hypothetical protein PR202_ga07936 [Eleusine coracana subsp. coracana]